MSNIKQIAVGGSIYNVSDPKLGPNVLIGSGTVHIEGNTYIKYSSIGEYTPVIIGSHNNGVFVGSDVQLSIGSGTATQIACGTGCSAKIACGEKSVVSIGNNNDDIIQISGQINMYNGFLSIGSESDSIHIGPMGIDINSDQNGKIIDIAPNVRIGTGISLTIGPDEKLHIAWKVGTETKEAILG